MPGTASALGTGSILDPAPNAALPRIGVATVSYAPFPLGEGSSVLTTLLLDGVTIGADHRYIPPQAGNATFEIPFEVPANMTSRPRALVATFDDGSPAVTSDWVDVDYVGGPANAPPALEVTSASYVVGMGFHLEGTLADGEQVMRLVANTTYGAKVQYLPEATWSMDVAVNPTTFGPHAVVLSADDGHLTTTRLIVVDIVPERVVLADETVAAEPVSAYASTWTLDLPPRILDGTVTFPCGSCGYGTIAGLIRADDNTTCALVASPFTARPTCGFETHEGSGTIHFVWAQNGGTRRILVEGWRV